MPFGQPVKVLIVEDNPADVDLLLLQLRQAGYDPESHCVQTEEDYIRELTDDLDLVLSDFHLPGFNGVRALELLLERGFEIPFIIVSGTIGEDTAVDAMRFGATDYLLKDRMARLGPAVERALEAGRLRRERAKVSADLRLFRLLVDQSNDTFVVIDPESGQFLDINQKGLSDLGYSREEFLALQIFDLDPGITPEMWSALRAAVQHSGVLGRVGSHRRKDGTLVPVEMNARWARVDRDYIVAGIRDISQRQENERALRASEQRFRTTLERLIEGCHILAPDWTILYINEVGARHSRSTVAELLGKSLLDLHPALADSPLFTAFHACMADSRPRHLENHYIFDDGTSTWFQLVIQPVPEGIFILSLDITERKRADQELAAQMDELQRWQDVTIEREERVQSLKAEVNEALALSKKPPRYTLATDNI